MNNIATWKKANIAAEHRWRETGQPQAIYLKPNGDYATMDKKMWMMLKPGKLICVVQALEPNLERFCKRTHRD